MTTLERKALVQEHRLCFNCLLDHRAVDCRSKTRCFRCRGKHHSTIHDGQGLYRASGPKGSGGENKSFSVDCGLQKPDYPEEGEKTHNSHSSVQSHGVLLSTVVIGIQNSSGEYEHVRALLDTGSQANYITSYCAQRLGLHVYGKKVNIMSLSQNRVNSRGGTSLNICHRNGGPQVISTEAIVIDKITADLPTAALPDDIHRQVRDLSLADPEFHVPGPIDCLLGADIFARCVKDGKLELGVGKPAVLNTKFGWVLMGSLDMSSKQSTDPLTFLVSNLSVEDRVDVYLKRFWELEEPTSREAAVTDTQCEEHYIATHGRDSAGRYMVRLPFKDTHLKLGASFSQAESRFLNLEKRLVRTPELYRAYREFMNDYLASGHMQKCNSIVDEAIPHYYLPHHGVYKESSSTTKLRVVFDASARTTTSSRCSLNDLLFSGPKLQRDITEILLHFRTHPVVFTADVKQMFRGVWLHPEDRRFQLILWRNSPDEELKTYQLNTVTFGMTCSPFLAMRSILQLIQDEGDNHPEAARVLRKDIFVDDIVTGARTVEEALHLQQQLSVLLGRAGFQLRKWTSNHPRLLEHIPLEERECPRMFSQIEDPTYEVLGLGWQPTSDTFVYGGSVKDHPLTKRGVLSSVARFYDPLGYLIPITFRAKALLQDLWRQGVQWDAPLTEESLNLWSRFVSELTHISRVAIPRFLTSETGSLHGFCDASERGYAAVIYFVPFTNTSVTEPARILIAKAKVAPLRTISIPRLELCGAHLLAKLLLFVQKTLATNLRILETTAWTDSTVVLAWIGALPYTLKTFVANRVTEIQDWLPPKHWRHVPTTENPADCASRGLFPEQFVNHESWFQGPTFLADPPEQWPGVVLCNVDPKHLLERRPHPLNVLVATRDVEAPPYWMKFSTWDRLIRVTAFIIRFLHNCTHRKHRRQGLLSLSELRIATSRVLKLVQRESFKAEFGSLEGGTFCSTRIQRLTPFVDPSGLLRVGGRIDHANVCFSFKHPILLPSDHHVTNLLIDHFHVLYLHAGPQLLRSMINRQYWILSGRSAIRKRIYRCVTCFRHRPVSKPPLMANLPDVRVNPAKTFAAVSLDFAGPVLGRTHRRSVARCKMYLCIFVCCCTKAVHIEVVSALSTEAFLASFQRFTSRRGLPLHVYSDQGTNFVGADNEIRKLFKYLNSSPQMESLADFATQNQIAWHFQPPAAPHFGGLHEAAVKQTKHHLRRVMGSQILTYEELSTLACRIEAALNSRPLCPLSEDPSEFDALTPGHFLCGAPLLTLPDPRTNVTANTRMRWRMVQEMSAHFWKRWSQEYLHTLIQRSKWYKSQDNIPLGALVLLKEDGLPPQCWKLGRITKAEPSKDGVVRVVKVRTAKGELTRPVVKVFPLPVC